MPPKNVLKKVSLILTVIGIFIALYLTYGEVTSNPLACSVGDCNKVQNSEYVNMLGVPMGILGVFYYFLLFTLIYKDSKKLTKVWLLWGILFSTYLTYLEFFVIEAICMWCMMSYFDILVISWLMFSYHKRKDSPINNL